MVVQTLTAILEQHPFAGDLEPKYVRALAGCAQNVQFDAGGYLWRQGDQADVFYLIRTGQVALEILVPHQGPLRVETINGGEVLGWSWLVPPYRWHFDGRAVTAVRALALDGNCLRRKCEEDHGLGYQVLKRFAPVIADRLTATRLKVLELHGAVQSCCGNGRNQGATNGRRPS